MTDDPTRREALKTLAVTAAGALVGGKPLVASGAPAAAGAAPPDALRFFTAVEAEAVRLLSERIVPADEVSPGARAAGVAERIDVVLHGSAEGERAAWREGLGALEVLCHDRYGYSLREASNDEHDALLTDLAAHEVLPQTPLHRFFKALKAQTVEAYYTSQVGLEQDLQYKGNTYLADFPGCNHPHHRS